MSAMIRCVAALAALMALATSVPAIPNSAVSAAQAGELPQPLGKPILMIQGKIGTANRDGTAQFDLAMLEQLGMTTIETKTPWFDGPVKFEGVPLSKLMSTVEASGRTIVAVALNDYSSEIPIGDIAKYNVILALKRNGEYMPVRDKGPLFIIYPYDSDPELRSQTYYGRSVWQIAKLIVK